MVLSTRTGCSDGLSLAGSVGWTIKVDLTTVVTFGTRVGEQCCDSVRMDTQPNLTSVRLNTQSHWQYLR